MDLGVQVQRERELQDQVFAEEKLLESVFPRVSSNGGLILSNSSNSYWIMRALTIELDSHRHTIGDQIN